MIVTHEEQQLRLRLRQLRWEADRVVSLELESLNGEALPAWAPGAHLDLHLPGGLVRQFSLCGTLKDSRRWRIAVLRELAGRGGSLAVHTSLKPGDVLDVVGPRNNFPLTPAPAYLFVAGGIGITPILPMVDAAAAAGAAWRLVYGGRTRAGLAFADQLLEQYPDQVTVVPQDEEGLLDLDRLLRDLEAGSLVYCCGPEPLLSAMEQRCPATQLRVERFFPRPRPTPDPTQEGEFELVLQASGRTLRVPSGSSVLEAMEAHGLDAPNSCREGICGTCETKVLDGRPDHRDSLLSEEERATGETMMICVGRALGERLVLDL